MSQSTSAAKTVSFTEQDLAAFSAASGDRNPLHLSPEYATRTPYGQPVVFGCLGALALLRYAPLPDGWRVTRMQAEFLRPMFVGVQYRVEVSGETESWVARLFDGSLPVVALTVKAGESSRSYPSPTSARPLFERLEAVVREQEDIVPGLEAAGQYACDPVALGALAARWGEADPLLTSILCWSSYLVGMELPGESALFFKIVLDLDAGATRPAAMSYRASVESLDSRYGQARMGVSLACGGHDIASGQFWSFVRPSLPAVEEIDSSAVRSDSLKGRVAVLTGATRGLGASMKQALEMRGAAVYSLSRSVPGDDLRAEVGDAADSEALRRLKDRVLAEQGRLDFLICNACPPAMPLRLEPNAADRVAAYINLAVSITLTPMCAFLDLLNDSGGRAVIISSIFAENPVREFPHYIAAKQAVETLARIATLQYPRTGTLIVRPQKLLTALTNTPMGRRGATSPGLLANRIAARLEDPIEPGTAEIFH